MDPSLLLKICQVLDKACIRLNCPDHSSLKQCSIQNSGKWTFSNNYEPKTYEPHMYAL